MIMSSSNTVMDLTCSQGYSKCVNPVFLFLLLERQSAYTKLFTVSVCRINAPQDFKAFGEANTCIWVIISKRNLNLLVKGV